MKILGIESSCDDTAAAVITADREVLSSVVWSQLNQHEAYGGVVPEIAARAHVEVIDEVIEVALSQANMSLDDIDLIAATGGPGLIGGVMVGMMTAKALALATGKPFIAVNHLEGHALTVRLTEGIQFPYLLLLISGGHCQWLAVEEAGEYRLLGATRDDALGEAFDKTAKMLGLGYPGGPLIEKMALNGDEKRFPFPVPLRGTKGCDFSFSGLKTAVRQTIQSLQAEGRVSEQDKADICASFQYAAAQSLMDRLVNAIDEYESGLADGITRQLVVAGGVAANNYIRDMLESAAKARGYALVVPPVSLCTDNAAMIAWAGYERFLRDGASELSFEPRARWGLSG